MLRRKITEDLLKWKLRPNRKSLIVQGARQVGKTFSIIQFGKDQYQETLSINFKETPGAAEIFSGDLNIDTLLLALRFRYPSMRLEPGKTLIFLDEIQECPEAITSLKFWATDHRFDVIASGSMLGIDYKRASSYPVGYVDFLSMHGLDFEEFLWSQGVSEKLIDDLESFCHSLHPIPPAVHTQMMKYFRFYTALGGMPEIVQNFTDTGDFPAADRIQKALLQGYLYDIAHYAAPDEKIKAEQCFLSLSRQLLEKENHKFQYKDVEHGGRAKKYYSSIDWLIRADIVTLSRNISSIQYDLADYAFPGNFRLYTGDLSLLIAMKDFNLKQQIVENSLSGNTKGGIYECVTADLLSKKMYALYFYKNETNKREIDFLIEKEGCIIPIEVKSGNGKATSLIQLMKNRPEIPAAYKLIDGNIGSDGDRIITLPLYMVMFL